MPSFAAAPTEHRALRRTLLYAGLAIGDQLSIIVGVLFAAMLWTGDPFGGQALSLLMVLMPIYCFVAFNRAAYSVHSLGRWQSGARRAITALAIAASVVIAIGFVLKVSEDFSRMVTFLGVSIAALLAAGFRYSARWVIREVLPNGIVDEVVLCDGTMILPERGERVINTTALGLHPRLDCPHMLDRIGTLLARADRVIVACAPDARMAWASALRGLGVNVEILVPEIQALGVITTNRYGAQMTGVVARGPLATREKVVKRLFDLAVLLAVLPGLLIVTAIVALLIKLEDGGPVFFVQQRIGQGNRLFRMYKFRSMRVAAADGEGRTSTARDDQRVTRIGRILRSTSIDELPQLFNVLKGDMSVVGPRPHALGSTAGDALFWEVDRRYFHRHAAKPGLTGLAQVRGFRGSTGTADALTKRIQSDLEYLSGWTLWRDVRILAATLKVILHPNAY